MYMCSHYLSQKNTDKFKLVNSIVNRKMVSGISISHFGKEGFY